MGIDNPGTTLASCSKVNVKSLPGGAGLGMGDGTSLVSFVSRGGGEEEQSDHLYSSLYIYLYINGIATQCDQEIAGSTPVSVTFSPEP